MWMLGLGDEGSSLSSLVAAVSILERTATTWAGERYGSGRVRTLAGRIGRDIIRARDGSGLRRRMTPAEDVGHALRLSGPRGPEIRDASSPHACSPVRTPALTTTQLGKDARTTGKEPAHPFNMSSIYKLAANASN